MSCCCCCVSPSEELLGGQRSPCTRLFPAGTRKKEQLVRGEQEQEEEQEEEQQGSRRNMDVALLREQYRWSRDRRRRLAQVLLFRTVSEELSETISIIPVAQGLTSPWEPNSSFPPTVTSDTHLMTSDPWHVHLSLHRRWCPGVSTGSSRRSSSSSQQDAGPSSDCSSSTHNRDEGHCRSRGDPAARSSMSSTSMRSSSMRSSSMRSSSMSSSSMRSTGSPSPDPGDGSKEDPPGASSGDSASGSDESSTPVASIACSPSSSPSSLHRDLQESHSRSPGSGVLQGGGATAWGGSRRFSALRFTRQLSVGGVGSTAGVLQDQNHHPFPNRKTPRISEAARRLGMYSSL